MTADTAADRRWGPTVLGIVLAIAITAAAVVGWLFLRAPSGSPESRARAELATARLALVNAAGAHYVGRLTAEDGVRVAIDLRVTNTGDASGTLAWGQGKALTYLHIDEKTFLSGGREAWMADGSGESIATAMAGLQVLRPRLFHGIDLPKTLRPDVLAYELDPAADAGRALQLGRDPDGVATIVTSDAVTTHLTSGRPSRVVLPTLDLRVTLLTPDDIARFHREVRPTVATLDEAWDSETTLETEMNWGSNCATSCTVTGEVTATPAPFLKVVIPGVDPPVADIQVRYRIGFSADGVPDPAFGCSDIIDLPGNGTATFTCEYSRSVGATVTASLDSHPILGRARADQLLHAVHTGADRSRAKFECPVDALHGRPKNPGCR